MIDLSPHDLELVKRVLRDHVPSCEVRAFGSRAKWTAKDYSDLDLAVIGESEIESATLAQLKEAFEDSTLPMRVDVLDWHDISAEFREVIKRESVELRTGSSWEQTTLGACVSLVRDSVTPAACGDAAYVGLEHIGQGTLALLRTGTAKDVESTKTAFRAGDILFGKLRPYFRKVVHPRFDGICSTDIWVLRPKGDVDAGFLFYLLASSEFVVFASQGAEGTRMPRAKWEQASRFPLRIPPLEEQRSIARTLAALDDKIELNRRMARTLDQAARALFKSWFVDFDPVRPKARNGIDLPPEVLSLFPHRFIESDIGEIPDGWEVRSLGHLVEFVYGSTLRSSERNGGSVPVFGSNGQVGWHDKRLVDGPGIVVGRKGNPGVVTWSQGDFFPIDTTFYVVPKGNISMRFLFFALSYQNLPSIAADSAVPGLNRNIAYMSRQLVPSAAVMGAFDSWAGAMLSRIARSKDEAETLADLRDALLRKLMSGEIRLADAEHTVKVYA